MSNLRDKYKAVPKATLRNKIQDEDSQVGSGDRAGFLSMEEGSNKFRAYPPHKEGINFYLMKAVHWIAIKKDNGDSGRRTVINARIQAGLKKDIFEEYIKGAKAYLEENEPKGFDDKIASLTGYPGGLNASFSWMMYANKIKKNAKGELEKEFGILEFNKTVRDGLNKIACFEGDDEPVDNDPFTDPDDGVPFVIDWNPKGKKATDKYSVSTGLKAKASPLTEEELEEFDKAKPLGEMFKTYSEEDFDLALQGLENFDDEKQIGFFETDEFQETIEELRSMVKKGKFSKDKEEPKKSASKGVDIFKKKLAKKEEEEEIEEEEEAPKKTNKKKGDKFSEMDRDELKEYIGENELLIKVFKGDDDEAIRVKIRTLEAESEEEVEEEEEEVAPKKTEKKISISVASKKKVEEPEEEEEESEEEEEDSLAAIKAKIKKNKK